MKKIFALLLAVIMSVSLAACDSEDAQSALGSDEASKVAQSETAEESSAIATSEAEEKTSSAESSKETPTESQSSKPNSSSRPAQTVTSKPVQTVKPSNDGFVPSLEITDVAAIKAHTDKVDGVLGNVINGKFENFSGGYYYKIEGGAVTGASFRTTPMDVDPSANVAGEMVFNTAAINAGYAKTEALMADFFARGYEVTFVYCFCADGTLEELSELPSARQMIERHVSLINPDMTGYHDIYYLAEMTSPSGKPMCMQIYFNGWHTISFSIYNNKGIPRCNHKTDDKWVSDQQDGTHATVCGKCVCAISSTAEPHSDSDGDKFCDKCQARLNP
ncbi:MAG: hypothetical protein IJ370_00175 [Oscillospiraceae bacterium]|nr:hypothetical protein [Oscillospiraceae bacterium]